LALSAAFLTDLSFGLSLYLRKLLPITMDGSVALPAEADEILLRVFTLAAPPPNVMDLEARDRPAVLTSPGVSLLDLAAQSV